MALKTPDDYRASISRRALYADVLTGIGVIGLGAGDLRARGLHLRGARPLLQQPQVLARGVAERGSLRGGGAGVVQRLAADGAGVRQHAQPLHLDRKSVV